MGMHTAYQLALSAAIFIVLLTGGVLSPRVATAATYYVATTGSDSNPGTQSAPFRTIKKGLDSMQAGDTLYLRGGTHNEAIDSDRQKIPVGTSWSNPVTIAAYPGETVTLLPTSGNSVLKLYAYNSSYDFQYIIFDRLILDGTHVGGTVELTGDEIGSGHKVHHIIFKNGEIRNSTKIPNPGTQTSPVNVHMAASNMQFLNSRIHHSGSGYGFYMIGYDIVIDGCEIDNNYGFGIQIYSNPRPPGTINNIIRNNRIHDNGALNNVFGATAITISHVDGTQIYNNLIYNNNYGGIAVGFGNPDNTQIYSNTFYNNGNASGGAAAISIGGSTTPTNTQVKNNIFWQNRDTIVNSGAGTVQTDNLTTDPQFVNPSGGDFHLRSTSPAIDAGIELSAVPTDLNGIARPQGTRSDIGAYEYQVSTVPAPENLRATSVVP